MLYRNRGHYQSIEIILDAYCTHVSRLHQIFCLVLLRCGLLCVYLSRLNMSSTCHQWLTSNGIRLFSDPRFSPDSQAMGDPTLNRIRNCAAFPPPSAILQAQAQGRSGSSPPPRRGTEASQRAKSATQRQRKNMRKA